MAQLHDRLEKRGQDLDAFIDDRKKLRSYLIRNSEPSWIGHTRGEQAAPLFSKEDISSEEKEEINQLCKRIFEIEQELKKLELIRSHLDDGQEFDLRYEDLVAYGFESDMRID